MKKFKSLFNEVNEQPEHEITVGNYTTKFFYMCGSAQKVMSANADKEGAEELTRMQDEFYKLEKEAMDNGEATDEQKEQARDLYNKIMSKAGEVGLADEIDDYMKMHIDSMEKGDPKLGFGRTDTMDESPNPARKFRVVTRAMRRKIAMRMRRMAKSATFKKKKENSKRRIASPEKILMKARKMAKQKILKKRFPRYSELGVNQKIKVDQIIQQRYSGGIAKLAKKLIKVVRRKEIEKVKKARQRPEEDDV